MARGFGLEPGGAREPFANMVAEDMAVVDRAVEMIEAAIQKYCSR